MQVIFWFLFKFYDFQYNSFVEPKTALQKHFCLLLSNCERFVAHRPDALFCVHLTASLPTLLPYLCTPTEAFSSSACVSRSLTACRKILFRQAESTAYAVAYHQCKALYIINTKCCISSSRRVCTFGDDIRLRRWYTHKCVMIYQACGLDKKRNNFCLSKVVSFLVRVTGLEPARFRTRT